MAFDESGYRSDVSFDVLSATQNDFVKVFKLILHQNINFVIFRLLFGQSLLAKII